MNFFYIEPEVAGGIGDNTVLDNSQHPPVVHKLHYVFDVWLGDALLEGFPSFIMTESAAAKLQSSGVTGVRFAPVETTASLEFKERYPSRELPFFKWMQIEGTSGHDDFFIAEDLRLVVSERALQILRDIGISHARIEEFKNSPVVRNP